MHQPGTSDDLIVQWLKKNGHEVTPENWLSMANFFGDVPEQDLLEQMPDNLRQQYNATRH